MLHRGPSLSGIGVCPVHHLRLGRRWARDLLATSALDEEALLADLDRSGATLAKVLDEYCYLRYTARR